MTGRSSHSCLPLEVDRLPLGFRELIDVLRTLRGTGVIVSLMSATATQSPLTLVGELAELEARIPDVYVFSVGDPRRCRGRVALGAT